MRVMKRLGAAALSLAAGWAVAQAAAATETAASSLDLAQYRGKVIYVDFWASWCGPCKLSFPYMKTLDAYYARRGLVVLAVNLDHDKARAQRFLEDVHNTLDVVYDPKGQLATKFNVHDMPTSVLIDREGKVRFIHKGFHDGDLAAYSAHVAELLDEKH